MHDPLCPDPHWQPPKGITCADCDLIAKVRADERERMPPRIPLIRLIDVLALFDGDTP